MSARSNLLLALADDELILGWRDSEWTGIAPVLEEDVAFSSIAQNEIGHARAVYELLADDADALAEAGVGVRLVKGAYVEPDDAALSWGEETDLAYVRLAHQLHAAGVPLALATHDPVLRESLLAALGPLNVEMLYGVREDDARELVARGIPVRLYVPYGHNWFRYWLRRIAESQGA